MNEKIKQFALQAGIIAPSENDIAPPMEKFAKLIVYDMLGELTNDDSLGPARIETIRQLSLRYGVAR